VLATTHTHKTDSTAIIKQTHTREGESDGEEERKGVLGGKGKWADLSWKERKVPRTSKRGKEDNDRGRGIWKKVCREREEQERATKTGGKCRGVGEDQAMGVRRHKKRGLMWGR